MSRWNSLTHTETARRLEVALRIAPALRDKFDFSDVSQYDDWAKLAFLGADAFIKKADSLAIAAGAKEDEEKDKAKALAAAAEQEAKK
jgi:hypothetical protein